MLNGEMLKPGVFITFDAECSIGGARGNPGLKPVGPARAMMGRYDGRELGIPLITDILSQHQLTATFFLEVFGDELGYPGETEKVCHYLMDRKQDIQLHIHPGYKEYGQKRKGMLWPRTDIIANLPEEYQSLLIAEGSERLRLWTGKRPSAFRAGGMAASEDFLHVLEKSGIRTDSSYTYPYAGKQCRFREKKNFNGSKWYGNVLELALSGFDQPQLPGIPAAVPLDLMGISFEECRDAIISICNSGADAVLILHSFSLFKVKNRQYEGGRLNRIVFTRFQRLCRWLSDHASAYPSYTFSQLEKAVEQGQYSARETRPIRMSTVKVLIRKFVQAVNNIYSL